MVRLWLRVAPSRSVTGAAQDFEMWKAVNDYDTDLVLQAVTTAGASVRIDTAASHSPDKPSYLDGAIEGIGIREVVVASELSGIRHAIPVGGPETVFDEDLVDAAGRTWHASGPIDAGDEVLVFLSAASTAESPAPLRTRSLEPGALHGKSWDRGLARGAVRLLERGVPLSLRDRAVTGIGNLLTFIGHNCLTPNPRGPDRQEPSVENRTVAGRARPGGRPRASADRRQRRHLLAVP